MTDVIKKEESSFVSQNLDTRQLSKSKHKSLSKEESSFVSQNLDTRQLSKNKHSPLSKASSMCSQFAGFSKLNTSQRYKKLVQMGVLTLEEVKYLKRGGVKKLDLADKLIENVIGYFQLPLGVAANFVIDGKLTPIPMAVEETSIIASASKTARWVAEHGFIRTRADQRMATGQIQIHQVKNFEHLQKTVQLHQNQWIQDIHTHCIPSMAKRGGGVQGFLLRKLKHEQGEMAILHVLINTCNAMGANMINQVCEYLKTPLEQASGEEVSVCILSNLADQSLASAEIVMEGLDPQLMKKIEHASIFAETDPYRATTSNKGVMNGIDAVLIASGNDWRAVSAGLHAFSARTGSYQSITQWRVKEGRLCGSLTAPFMIGVVGGMTRIHPTAKICMKMMKIHTAEELARICAAVGLVQNLGALRALTTVGIIEGHMKLHIKNLTQDAGAKGWEFTVIQKHLETLHKVRKRISLSHAIEALKLVRERIQQVQDFKTLNKQKWAKQLLKDLRKKYK